MSNMGQYEHLARPVRAEEVTHGHYVRPEGWYHFYESVGADVLDDEHVNIMWQIGSGAPGPATVFHKDEIVEIL